MKSTDILIVGGGPAGSSCAARLASEGRVVTLVDREVFPRHKVCGGGIPVRTRSLLPSGYQAHVETTITSTTLEAGWGRHFTLSGTTLADVVDRTPFDAFLLDEARRQGAEVIEGAPLKALSRIKDGWQVEAGSITLRAKVLCACDGVNSRTARLAGAPRNDCGLALEGYLSIPSAALEAVRSTAIFNFRCEQYGYGWVFPRREEYAIGIGTSRWPACDLRTRLNSFAASFSGSVAPGLKRVKGAPLPRFTTARDWYAKDQLYLIGDAAGLVDPLTGEGIFYAVQSGILAAEAILKDGPMQYHTSILQTLVRDLEVASYFARRRAMIPAWLMGLSLSFGRCRVYAEKFIQLLSGQMSYEDLYAEMHRGRRFF